MPVFEEWRVADLCSRHTSVCCLKNGLCSWRVRVRVRERVSLSAAFRTPELNALGEKIYVANWDNNLTSLSPYYLPLQH